MHTHTHTHTYMNTHTHTHTHTHIHTHTNPLAHPHIHMHTYMNTHTHTHTHTHWLTHTYTCTHMRALQGNLTTYVHVPFHSLWVALTGAWNQIYRTVIIYAHLQFKNIPRRSNYNHSAGVIIFYLISLLLALPPPHSSEAFVNNKKCNWKNALKFLT